MLNIDPMGNLIFIIFNLIGGYLLFKFFQFKFVQFTTEVDKPEFWKFEKHKYILSVSAMVILGLSAIKFFLPNTSLFTTNNALSDFQLWASIAMSFSISAIWAYYVRTLDIYERERWVNILIVFILGCLTTFLVFPISGFLNEAGFVMTGAFINDFFYCFIGIGMVEEFVKLIPLLIIMRFRKVVNEPFDFILYASVSALGFAFIENVLYINRSDFEAINGRSLMAGVAHMTFSSVIGYSIMLSTFKKSRKLYYLFGGFILASAMHGFYDFWLINPTAQQVYELSFIFYLASVHFWFTMKNKAIRSSYFHDSRVEIDNDKLRYYLILWLTIILMSSGVLVGIHSGRDVAYQFLMSELYSYGFLIYYLGFSFSKFTINERVQAICQVPFDVVIPKEPSRETIAKAREN